MNRAASHLASRKELQRMMKGNSFLKVGQGSHKQINKKELVQARSPPFGGKRGQLGGLSHLPLRNGKAYVVNYLIGADQKIPDCPVRGRL